MSDKHAAALTALDANVEIRWNEVAQRFQAWLPHTDQQAYSVANMGELTGVLVDDYAAAAEALGLEVGYEVCALPRCIHCGKATRHSEMRWDHEQAKMSPLPVCAPPCQTPKPLRYEGTPEAKAIWEAVDKAAAQAPEWIKQMVKGTSKEETDG